MNKPKKVLLTVLISVVAFVVVIIVLISPIAKYLIQKYDTRFTGREITLDWAYVNPFTGYVYLNDIEIKEFESDSVFLSADGLMADFSLFKLLSKTYEFSAVKLTDPIAVVHQSDTFFNFNDLITTFSGDTTKPKSNEVTKFNLLNIEIENGEFHYIEHLIPINYFIKEVNIKSVGLRYDSDTMPIDFSLRSGTGSGKIGGKLAINLKDNGYTLGVKIDSFDLDIINQYVKDLTNYGTFAAMLDAELSSTGNFISADSISTTGKIAITNFQFGRTREDDFASFDRLVIAINRLSPKDFIYRYDSICLTKPFFKYQRFDSLDNVQTMFGEGGENVKAADGNPKKFNLVIEIAHVIDRLSRNFLNSQYQIGRFAIYDGDLQYEDYSMGEKFSVALSPFNVKADSVDKAHSRVKLTIHSGIKPHGDFDLAVNINPRDSSYFFLHFQFKKLALAMMNPFLVTHTGFPLDRGSMDLHGDWNVVGGQITSTNHLVIIDPRVSKRIKGADTRWLPMNLAMALVRERGNVIDYEVPISGKLGDPAFNFWDVITDILTNIVMKPATTGYRIDVRHLEMELERSQSIKWEMSAHAITRVQEKYIDKIIRFLKSDPTARISIHPKHFEEKEKELILLFEAKKKYYLHRKKKKESEFSDDDSLAVTRMSIKDRGFINYLDEHVKDKTLFTVQDKAIILIGAKKINAKFQKLVRDREAAFRADFIKANVVNQLDWKKGESLVPFNGFSYYEISYKDQFPDYLVRAFEKMCKLNNERPRDAYQKGRKGNEKEE